MKHLNVIQLLLYQVVQNDDCKVLYFHELLYYCSKDPNNFIIEKVFRFSIRKYYLYSVANINHFDNYYVYT